MAIVVDPVTGKRTFVRHDLLNKRQRAFVAAYDGNASEACRISGYSVSQATKLIRMPKIIAALEKKASEHQHSMKASMTKVMADNARLVGGAIAAREDRQAFWTNVMLAEDENMMFRLKASELLGKAQGDFIERHEHSGGVALLVVNPYDDEAADDAAEVEATIVEAERTAESALNGGE
jgi:phage terminase small subunit